jgi:hypothetical protein
MLSEASGIPSNFACELVKSGWYKYQVVADGLEDFVSPRLLCASMVIEATYSITNYELPQYPLGLSYSVNVHAGAHPRLST